jgi:hypothetical protein
MSVTSNNFSQRFSSQLEQKKPLGPRSDNDKLLESFNDRLKFLQKNMTSLPKSFIPTDEDSASKTTDQMLKTSSDFMETMLAKNKFEAKIAKKGSGTFDPDQLLGKEIGYNDSGRQGNKVENSLTFSYHVDKKRFSDAMHLKASLRVMNSAGRELDRIEADEVNLGLNQFKWTPEAPKKLTDDDCTLEVDLTFQDEEGKSQTIKGVTDFSGKVTSHKYNAGRRKRELMIDDVSIDIDKVVQVFADTAKQSQITDSAKQSQMEDNNKQQYLYWIDNKVTTKNGHEIVVGGIDWSDSKLIKVINKNDPKQAYDVNDIVSLSSGDSPAPAPELTGEEKLQKLLEKGEIYVGKKISKELLRGVYKVNDFSKMELKLGEDESFGKYKEITADIDTKDSQGVVTRRPVGMNATKNTYLLSRGDEIFLERQLGFGKYEASIKVTAQCVVSGCYVTEGKLILQTDQGDISADDITGVSS